MAIEYTPIVTGAAANAAVVNAPLQELDDVLAPIEADFWNWKTEVTNARGGYASLDARLDTFIAGANNTSVTTQADGAAAQGQAEVVVDSSTGFLAGMRVVYPLAGGTLEANVIADIHSGTQLTMTTNLGTGGIANNALISALAEVVYQAGEAIYHGADVMMLHDALGIVSERAYDLTAFRADRAGGADISVALQATIDAAEAMWVATGHGQRIKLPPGMYNIAAGVSFGVANSNVTIEGAGIRRTMILATAAIETLIGSLACSSQAYRHITGISFDGGVALNVRQFIDASLMAYGEIDHCEFYRFQGVSATTVDGDSASAAAELYVADPTLFRAGDLLHIGDGTARAEMGIVSVVEADRLTMTANLAFTHTAVDADDVTSLNTCGIRAGE